MILNPSGSRANSLPTILLGVVALAIAFRLWTSFCFFPLAEWNSVRLAPAFMLRFGPTPYPGLDGGPLTTWIYGPISLLLNLPATLATNTISALLIAAGINLLIAVIPVAATVFLTDLSPVKIDRIDRLWALLLCLALWPNTSLQYIQADNTALAFGMLGNLFLTRAQNGSRLTLLFAALCTSLAVWSKQTTLGLVLAQLIWLGKISGFKAASRYGVNCAALGLGLGLGFVAHFGFNQLWLNLVQIPGRLPFAGEIWNRTRDFWMHLSGYVLLPGITMIITGKAIWRRNSPWPLPSLTWLCLLPTALIATYKIGGATNSLNGVLYLLPFSALALVVGLRATPKSRAWLALITLIILTQQFKFAPLLPVRPVVAHLIEAQQLAKKFPNQIYFPWHPLVTFFSDHRFYHAEDGLYTRHVASIDLDKTTAMKNLPAHWSITAVPGWRGEGVYRQFQPLDAKFGFNGKWGIYLWPRQDQDGKH